MSTFVGTVLSGNQDDDGQSESSYFTIGYWILRVSCSGSYDPIEKVEFSPITFKFFWKPLKDGDLITLVQEFYAKFIISTDSDTLFHLTLAVSYLGISPLLDLCYARIASLNKDETVKQITDNLRVLSDFVPMN